MYKRSSHTPDVQACVYTLAAEHKNLSKDAYAMLNMLVIVSYIQSKYINDDEYDNGDDDHAIVIIIID